MTRIRKWLLTATVVLALLVPFGGIAAAGGSGGGHGPGVQLTSSDPGDGGFGH